MEFAGISLRDILVVASGLTVTYAVILVLRLVQIGRHRRFAQAREVAPVVERTDEPTVEASPVTPSPEPKPAAPEAPAARPEPTAAAASRATAQALAEIVPPADDAVEDFGAELIRSHEEMDLKQLREEVGRLRLEVVSLRNEIGQLKATRHISPQYADALALAERGLSAQDLADRCGISLGEAELVWSLSHGPANFDQEEDYGGEYGRKFPRSA